MRIRTVKPDFWLHEAAANCAEFTRLLALALLNLADDEGYFYANPTYIRGQIFPYLKKTAKIELGINQLLAIGYLETTHSQDGRRVGRVVNFNKHQRINRPIPSSIKPLQNNTTTPTHPQLTDSSVSPHPQLTEPSLLEGKGKERKGKEYPPTPKGECVSAPGDAIAGIYAAYPKKVGKPAAYKAIARAIRTTAPDALLASTRAYAAAVEGEDPAYIPHPATWFNQERYADDPATWTRATQPPVPAPSRYTPPPRAEAPRRIYTQHPEPAVDWRTHPAIMALYDGAFSPDVAWTGLPMEGQEEIIATLAKEVPGHE